MDFAHGIDHILIVGETLNQELGHGAITHPLVTVMIVCSEHTDMISYFIHSCRVMNCTA